VIWISIDLAPVSIDQILINQRKKPKTKKQLDNEKQNREKQLKQCKIPVFQTAEIGKTRSKKA